MQNDLLQYERRAKGISSKTKIFTWRYETPKRSHMLIEADPLFGDKQYMAKEVIISILNRFEDLSNIKFEETSSNSIIQFIYSDESDGIILDESNTDLFLFESYIYHAIAICIGMDFNNNYDSIFNKQSKAYHLSNEDIILMLKKYGQIF